MFRIVAKGRWTREQVVARHVASSLKHDAQINSLVNKTWADAQARGGMQLFDGPMCRLESFNATADRLELMLSHTSYRVFYGTNMMHPEIADRHGADAMANPIGLSAALFSADGYLMLGKRNATVAYYPNYIHPFAGALEPADRDPFAGMLRELDEEVALREADIASIQCVGIIEDQALRQPELIFNVQSRLHRRQIEARVQAREHHGCIAINLKSIPGNLNFTPVARGTIEWCASEFRL